MRVPESPRRRKVARCLAATLVTALLLQPAQAAIVFLPKVFFVNGTPVVRLLPTFQPDPEPPGLLPGLPMVSDEKWNETAVRQVMHVFAYGGQATDAQVATWADMSPADAIEEMLTFDEHNLKLSKPSGRVNDNMATRDGTLWGLSAYFRGNSLLEAGFRSQFDAESWNRTYATWTLAARLRGLNPFRQKIGLFETNYHMSVNQNAGPTPQMIMTYYDTIMESLESGEPYQRTLNAAALTAAVTTQYGHVYYSQRWDYNYETDEFECFCNDDFAREYHQLFFGILGVADSEYHEQVSIEGTALALTGIERVPDAGEQEWESDVVVFRRYDENDRYTYVAPGPLEVLGEAIPGEAAEERIGALSEVAIEHYESLANLPYIIIQGLADDELDGNELSRIRRAWRSMENKDLLKFLRAYAVSTLFHSPNRVKHLTSIDRYLLLANLAWHDNQAHYYNLAPDWFLFWQEEVVPFIPHHDVFGHQTGLEAAASAELFRKHWYAASADGYRYNNVAPDIDADNVPDYEFDWGALMPREKDGSYKVATVARWLWERFTADGGANFGTLERAEMYAQLATGTDFAFVVNEDDPQALYDASDIESTPSLAGLVDSLGEQTLALRGGSDARLIANERVGNAVAFVSATPFIFVQQGQ